MQPVYYFIVTEKQMKINRQNGQSGISDAISGSINKKACKNLQASLKHRKSIKGRIS
jgi:hypothetical protein